MRPFRPFRVSLIAAGAVAAVGGFAASAPQASAVLGACAPASITVDGQTVAIFTITGSCTWSVPTGATHISALVVGGGGSGGRSDEPSVGGGGGGGVAEGTELALSGDFVITVGAGGTNTQSCATWPETSNGGDSSISNATLVAAGSEVEIIADGGARGAGCGENDTAESGGSGGGGHSDWVPNGGAATKGSFTGLTGITLYGNAGGDGNATEGYSGGGGGGAGAVGSDATSGGNGGDGGEGVESDITGTAVVYGSGGGGIGSSSNGDGGTNAGDGKPYVAAGVAVSVADAVDGTGGGGGGAYNETSGSGGSGIVVIRYTPAPSLPPTGSSTTTPIALLAAAFVSIGAGFTALRRRRTA